MIEIEFYGIPRLRAGTNRLRLEASSVGQALRALAHACPTLDGSVLGDGRVQQAYKLSLNGERFVSDPQTPLTEGDVLLLLSADVGG
jgi:molybdopterin converting factor small subunit